MRWRNMQILRSALGCALAAGLGAAPALAQKASLPYFFNDADDRATVFFLSSDDLPVGAHLSIFGDDFGSTGRVTLAGVTAPIRSWAANRIVVDVPSGSSGPVVVEPQGGQASSPFPLTVRSGRIRYLDPSAASGGDGSAGAPWRDFPTANAAARPGDFIIVRAGSYTATGGESAWSASTSGTAGNSITWYAAPGAYVLVDGSNGTKQAVRVDGAHVNIVGVVGTRGKYQNIFLNGNHSRAIDCESRDSDGSTSGKGQGINVNADFAKAYGNYVHDNWSHGFYAYANDIEVAYNYVAGSGCCGVTDSRGYGIQVYSAMGPVFARAKVYRNYVTASNRSGIVAGQYADGTDIYENIITANDERAILVHYGAVRTRIRNNVMYRNDNDRAGFYEIDLYDSTDVEVMNNSTTGPYAINKRSTTTGTVTIDANLYDGTTRWTWNGTNYGTLSAWRSGTGKDPRSQAANPQYRNPASNDFRPGTGSPLIDAGDDGACARPPAGARCDQGAFETPGAPGGGGTPPVPPANVRRTDRRS